MGAASRTVPWPSPASLPGAARRPVFLPATLRHHHASPLITTRSSRVSLKRLTLLPHVAATRSALLMAGGAADVFLGHTYTPLGNQCDVGTLNGTRNTTAAALHNIFGANEDVWPNEEPLVPGLAPGDAWEETRDEDSGSLSLLGEGRRKGRGGREGRHRLTVLPPSIYTLVLSLEEKEKEEEEEKESHYKRALSMQICLYGRGRHLSGWLVLLTWRGGMVREWATQRVGKGQPASLSRPTTLSRPHTLHQPCASTPPTALPPREGHLVSRLAATPPPRHHWPPPPDPRAPVPSLLKAPRGPMGFLQQCQLI
ncbi:hypothetical protein O3P69_010355 [Scylla paramamosain]|uniref:Uncharacterized protein n=1 Tax=Scylla paramamosain TaxID=85552 RepID=A0AAW0TWM3_SCYPA